MLFALNSLSNESRKKIHSCLQDINDLHEANRIIQDLCGIEDFFLTDTELSRLKEHISEPFHQEITPEKNREFGDFQTPGSLTDEICVFLKSQGSNPTKVIEPTFGQGNFILSALLHFENIKEIYGVEIQESYVWDTKFRILEEYVNGKLTEKVKIKLFQSDIFHHSFDDLQIDPSDSLLIIGNPPWVTNSELGSLDSTNLPQKYNIKNHKGIDALTGSSNFDIAEYILVFLLEKFSNCHGVFSMICKNTVIRNIIYDLPKTNYGVDNMTAFSIEAKKIFEAAVEASIFITNLGARKQKEYCCIATSWGDVNQQGTMFGWLDGKFVSDFAEYEKTKIIDGECPIEWRQGVKHDAAKVMELQPGADQTYINGYAETVSLEDDLIYGLVKSSYLKSSLIDKLKKYVLVPQRKVGGDTQYIEQMYPLTWSYLTRYQEVLDQRKSSIYRNNPKFSIFGIGDYSFSPYKVAISGLYKEPHFSLILPINNKPVMLDDTCYFLGFHDLKFALITCALLNSSLVLQFLKNIAFVDSKRPFTKKILMRMDLQQVCEIFTYEKLCADLENLGLSKIVTIEENDFTRFKESLGSPKEQLVLLK